MPSNEQQQHYISKFLIKQWAEYGKVGVVCMYHRDSAIVSASARTLHSAAGLWSRDLEHGWNDPESHASDTINDLKESLGPNGDNYAAAHQILSEPRHFDSLIELAVIHHARSLAVPVQRIVDGRAESGQTKEIEEAIQRRRSSAQRYYDCGLVVSVLPPSSPAVLGAVPVLHTPSLGDTRLDKPALFMMPVTPQLVIAGDPDMGRGQVVVRGDSVDGTQRLTWQLMAEPGLLRTPYLICKPSELERTTEAALAFTEGAPFHWSALCDRMALYREGATRGEFEAYLATWRPLEREYRNRQGWYDDPLTTNSMRRKHGKAMARIARIIQEHLDSVGIPICDCRWHRDKKTDPIHAALWELIVPTVVCQKIREKQNAASPCQRTLHRTENQVGL